MVSTDVREKANPGPRAQGSSHLMDSWNLLELGRTGLAFAQTSEQQCINCHVSIFATEQQVRFSSHGQWLPLYGHYEEHNDGMKWDSMGFPNLTSGLCQNERLYQFIVCGYKKKINRYLPLYLDGLVHAHSHASVAVLHGFKQTPV